jgi:predicted amidohydrolase YtcJ
MDLAIFSARIFTGNAKQPWVEALGIKDNKIAIVGSNAQVKKGCRRNTTVLELKGRLITPGLVDAHTHFVNLGLNLQRVNLMNLPSLAACRARIAQAAAKCPPGEWIIGRGWNEHFWEEKREPTRFDLDGLTPRNPAMMIRACGHSVWVNTAALACAGIDRHTPDPQGARIARDPASGEPTGLLMEMRRYMEKFIPPPTEETRKKAGLAAQQEALRLGVTAVHSCETLREWDALSALEEEGKLKIRVHHTIPYDGLEEGRARSFKTWRGGQRLWFGQVKLYADGSLGSGTALLHAPYADNPSDRGLAVNTPQALRKKVLEAYQDGYSVAIHAIGDKAVTNSLKAIASARKAVSGPRRDRIEHVQLFQPSDLPLFRELGVMASVQPVHLSTDWSTAEKKWGVARCRNGYAWRSLLRAGIRVQFGSDAPVEPINPLLGLQAAVTRKDSRGNPPEGWFPEERLTLGESIRAFTALPAWSSRKERVLGTLTPGRLADLTVFEQDLFQVPPEEWLSVEIEMTVVDGEIVYRKARD